MAYLELNSRLSALPAVAVFVGITSFLFHARNTVPHHRLDLTGVVLLAPAVFDTAVARVLPLDEARRPGAIVGIRVLLLAVPVVVVAVLHPTVPSWDPLWSITVRTPPRRSHPVAPTLAAAAPTDPPAAATGYLRRAGVCRVRVRPLDDVAGPKPAERQPDCCGRNCVLYCNGTALRLRPAVVLTKAFAPAAPLPSGCPAHRRCRRRQVVLLIVGNNDEYWTCVATQLGEPHYWGHFLGAAAVTLLSRSSSSAADPADYQRL